METEIPGRSRYSIGAMIMHWLIAIGVIANWRIAESAEHAGKAESQAIMSNHMALGIIILVLTVMRIAWRLINPPPPLASHLKGWEVAVARITHAIFYILLISLPMLGWVAMSSYGQEVSIFGLFDWPALPLPQNKAAAESVFEIHHTLGGAMVLLIGLHLLGVLKHTFYDRDGNIFRMLPFGKVKA